MDTYVFAPDYVAPPGDTLFEALEERQMTQAALAQRMGRPRKTINEIIRSKTRITAETAIELETVLNIPASFWLNIEQQYQEYIARTAQIQRLSEKTFWTKHFPVNEMRKRGWVTEKDPTKLLQQILSFFGMAYPEQWDAYWGEVEHAFRIAEAFKDKVDSYALAVWLREGERQAQNIICEEYDARRFRQILLELRSATRLNPKEYFDLMVRLCAKVGVAVVFVEELPGTHICGATHWISPTKAIIQLSRRYKKSDMLWFTFYHEAGHIILHGKTETFIEVEAEPEGKEAEADAFSRDMLIPPEQWRRFKREGRPFSEDRIRSFAEQIQVGADIIVGRLQHERLIRFVNHSRLRITLHDWPGEWVDSDDETVIVQ